MYRGGPHDHLGSGLPSTYWGGAHSTHEGAAAQHADDTNSWMQRLTSDDADSTADSYVRMRSPSPNRFQYNPDHSQVYSGGVVPHNDGMYGGYSYPTDPQIMPSSQYDFNPGYQYSQPAYDAHAFQPYTDLQTGANNAFYEYGGGSSSTPSAYNAAGLSNDDYQLGQLGNLHLSDSYQGQSSSHIPPLSLDHGAIMQQYNGESASQTRQRQSDHGHQSDSSKKRNGKIPETVKDMDKAARQEANPWYSYDNETKTFLVDMIHLYTGLLKESLSKKVRRHFDNKLKDALMSGDETKILWAVERIISFDRKGYRNKKSYQPWMDNMTMPESIVVVNRMSYYSEKDPEHMRNFFLYLPLSQAQARKILNDVTGEVCMKYVVEMGLDRRNDKMIRQGGVLKKSKTIEVWPWMRGLTDGQKKKVIHKVMKANSTNLDEMRCYTLLQQPQMDEFVTKSILDGTESEVRNIVQQLEGRRQWELAAHPR
ncbi:hypothetical protein CBS101457_000137 [Exobasidium rhododendri]|nr:hypothetical protein CBS101457_000137 [Exobasidium rhododendri]